MGQIFFWGGAMGNAHFSPPPKYDLENSEINNKKKEKIGKKKIKVI